MHTYFADNPGGKWLHDARHSEDTVEAVRHFYLEAVDKQQVEFSTIFLAQEILLQILQVGLNVSLHLVKTEGYTTIYRHAVSGKLAENWPDLT